jgi:hypothetical protein
LDDDDFEKLLNDYLDPPAPTCPEGLCIDWKTGDQSVGLDHIEEKHGLTRSEVEDALYAGPPETEAKKKKENKNRTVFWGPTRLKKWVFIVCEDNMESKFRHLKPITAFIPDEGRAYWEEQ